VREFLIVSATEVEARYVPEGLPLLVTGVGKTAAATAVAAELAQRDTNGLTVINVGTAGALRDGLSGLFTPGVVLNHELSADAIRALGIDVDDRFVVPDGDETVLATGDVFVTDPVVRAQLAERAHLVDMEGFAVAYACRQFGVPVRLVKHVSDDADETALDWASAVDNSAKALAEWLHRELT
jgi:adenosylhomocysteine nucleosidase